MKKTPSLKKSPLHIRLALAVALGLLAIFFWPKVSSVADNDFTAAFGHKTYYKNMECGCIGFVVPRESCRSCTQYADCYGIPVSCTFFECRALINGTWQDVPCNGPSVNQTPPTDRASCEAQGGIWGPVGLLPEEKCNLPTTDAGKICSDSRQCQSACIANLSQADYERLVKLRMPVYTTGTCAAWKLVIGCNAYVENGVVYGILCVD